MPAEFATIFQAIGFATSTAKGLKDLDDKVTLNSAVYEIQEALLSAQQIALASQQEMTAVIEAKSALEKEIAALRAFETEKSRYQMHETEAGGITYLVKEDARNGEPSHHICANCYQNSVKTILQKCQVGLKCDICKSTIQLKPRSMGFVTRSM